MILPEVSIDLMAKITAILLGFSGLLAAFFQIIKKWFKEIDNLNKRPGDFIILGVAKGVRFISPKNFVDVVSIKKARRIRKRSAVCVHNIDVLEHKNYDWVIVDESIIPNGIRPDDEEKIRSVCDDRL